ncbi:hypothetical protein TWF225_002540 [Orbilia oligospora]|nr:hypothetical protein TWF225_002540 [Orbilia oligospora]KAF3266214.1 hypothetical protein TWF217_001892 [Orbilia oligospora]KAF3268675.1 hypothetical protein TWF128_007047 [Orbilia oligospora]
MNNPPNQQISEKMHWRACLDPAYFESYGYQDFLYKLYGVGKESKPQKTLSISVKESLLIEELEHLELCNFNPQGQGPNEAFGPGEHLTIAPLESLRVPFSLNHIDFGVCEGKKKLNPLVPASVKDYIAPGNPFSTGEPPNAQGKKDPNTAQWSYLEMAYRIRMLWQQLWYYAGTKGLENNDKITYLHRFFDDQVPAKIKEGRSFINGIFPSTMVAVLKTNQQRINQRLSDILAPLDMEINAIDGKKPNIQELLTALNGELTALNNAAAQGAQNGDKVEAIKKDIQKASGTLKKLDTERITLLKKKCACLTWTPEKPLFQEENVNNDLGIAIPWVVSTAGGQKGPAGPISLEVSFILALQVQGIDLARVRALRRLISEIQGMEPDIGSATGEKFIATAIKIYGEDDDIITERPAEFGDITRNKLPPNGPAGRLLVKAPTAEKSLSLDTIEDIHTTVFNSDHVDGDKAKRTGSVGVYCGMDLLAGMDRFFLGENKNPCAGFVIHPTDISTVQVVFSEIDIGDNAKQSQNQGYCWYRFTHPDQLPTSEGNEYLGFSKTALKDFNEGNKALSGDFLSESKTGGSRPLRPTENWYTNRRVRCHAHPVTWHRDDFEQTFRCRAPERKLGGYNGKYKMHLYLLSEVDTVKYPRQTFIKHNDTIKLFGYE